MPPDTMGGDTLHIIEQVGRVTEVTRGNAQAETRQRQMILEVEAMKAGNSKQMTMMLATLVALPAMAVMSNAESKAQAAEASSGARAGHDGYGNRQAEANAEYDGHLGYANTRSRTGPVSTARGVAWGLDEDGLSISLSHAISGPLGLSAARNLNLSIGTNGEVAMSRGQADSRGNRESSAYAGGGSGVRNGQPVAYGEAGGTSDLRGQRGVTSQVSTRTSRARNRSVHAYPGVRPHTTQRGNHLYRTRPMPYKAQAGHAVSRGGPRQVNKCATGFGGKRMTKKRLRF
ncbi:MAG: hypothetical protein ACPGXK_06270 [Phycisphaerae bacterium]